MKQIEGEVKRIDPRVYNELTEEAAIVMLEIARDLRSGVIPPNLFLMSDFHTETDCGTAHCICGWMEYRMNQSRYEFFKFQKRGNVAAWPDRLGRLFSGGNKSDPQAAADAIEAYLFNYARFPWSAP